MNIALVVLEWREVRNNIIYDLSLPLANLCKEQLEQ